MSRPLQVDQIAGAFVAVPGISIDALDVGMTDTLATTGAFQDIAGTTSETFNVPIAGTYLVTFHVSAFASVASSTVMRWRLNVDSDSIVSADTAEFDQQLINGERTMKTMSFFMDLTIGSFSIKPQWKRVSGTGTLNVASAVDVAIAKMVLVSGSGAGGTLVQSMETSITDPQVISAVQPTYDDLTVSETVDTTPLSFSVDTGLNEQVLVMFSGSVKAGAGGNLEGVLAVDIDGTIVHGMTLRTSAASTAEGINISWMSAPLSQGSHTVKLKAARLSAGFGSDFTIEPTPIVGYTPVEGCKFQVVRFRGGLVPVQADGVEVIGTPRAYNFIGADVQDNASVADISLPLAVTSSGETVEMLNQIPSVSGNLSSATFAAVPNISEQQFTVAYAGTYKLDVYLANVSPTGIGTFGAVTHRLRFDEAGFGGFTEQFIGNDDSTWRIITTRQHASVDEYTRSTIPTEVTLEAGTHKVKVEYKDETFSTGTSRVTSNTPFIVRGTAVIGSGASGIIHSEKVLDQDFSTTSATLVTVQDSGGDYTVTITTKANEEVLLTGNVGIACDTNPLGMAGGIGIDGAEPTGHLVWLEAGLLAGEAVTRGFAVLTPPLSAGLHTFRFRVRRFTGTGTLRIMGSGTGTSRKSSFQATVYRGGLVPVYDDGTLVADKPQAFKFGEGLRALNAGGQVVVNADFAGDGLEVYSIETDPALRQAITSLQPTYTDLDVSSSDTTPIAHTISTNANESVLVIWTGGMRNAGGTGKPIMALDVDGSIVHAVTTQQPHALMHDDASFSFLVTGLSAGSHTFKMKSARTASGDGNHYIEPTPLDGFTPVEGCKFQVARFKGGYTIPENFPVMETDDTDLSIINFKKAEGAETELRVPIGGITFKATAPLAVDVDNSGLLGLDPLDTLAAGWVYFYAVPSTVVGEFSIVASTTDPDGGGPSSYSVWKDLAEVYVISISPGVVRATTQLGDIFSYHDLDATAIRPYEATAVIDVGAKTTWYDIDSTAGTNETVRTLANAKPLTAVSCMVKGGGDSDAAVSGQLVLDSGKGAARSTPWTPTGSVLRSASTLCFQEAQNFEIHTEIPLYSGTFRRYWIAAVGATQVSIVIKGYRRRGGVKPVIHAPIRRSDEWNYLDLVKPTGVSASIEALWQFDQTANDLLDRTANSHDLTLVGTDMHTIVGGRKARLFDGSTTYLNRAIDAGLQILGALTMEAVVVPSATINDSADTLGSVLAHTDPALSDASSVSNLLYQIYVESITAILGRLGYDSENATGTNSGLVSNGGLTTGQVFYLAYTRSGAGLVSIYVNGILLDSGSTTLPTDGSTGRFTIGAMGVSDVLNFFAGAISSVRLTAEAYTVTQVEEVYDRLRGRSM